MTQPNLVDMAEGIADIAVPLAGDLTVSYKPLVVAGLRQLMAHLGEGKLPQQEMLKRLSDPNFAPVYLAQLGAGLILGPNANELADYHDAVLNANQVKMPPKIELTAMGMRLNEAGKQLYMQCTMTPGAYAQSLEEASMHDTE